MSDKKYLIAISKKLESLSHEDLGLGQPYGKTALVLMQSSVIKKWIEETGGEILNILSEAKIHIKSDGVYVSVITISKGENSVELSKDDEDFQDVFMDITKKITSIICLGRVGGDN